MIEIPPPAVEQKTFPPNRQPLILFDFWIPYGGIIRLAAMPKGEVKPARTSTLDSPSMIGY